MALTNLGQEVLLDLHLAADLCSEVNLLVLVSLWGKFTLRSLYVVLLVFLIFLGVYGCILGSSQLIVMTQL